MAATASEANPVAVLTNEQLKRKNAYAHPLLLSLIHIYFAMYKEKEIVCLQMGSRLCNGGIKMSKIAFIGTGIIGAGLAVNALAAGNECTLYDVVDLQTAKDRIKGIFDTMVEAGAYTQEKADAAYAKASFTNNLKEAVTDAVFIQEAVPERIELRCV